MKTIVTGGPPIDKNFSLSTYEHFELLVWVVSSAVAVVLLSLTIAIGVTVYKAKKDLDMNK